MFNRKIAPKEAIERIEIIIKNSRFSQADKSALKMACNTLEKQIAKKPLDKTQEYDGEYGLCPYCEQIVADYKEYKRCSECGQALNWSDTE